MDGLNADEMARKNLLDRLLNSVQQVQAHFGASQEIATESDARVSALCVEWEMVLTHAAKKPKPRNSLRLTGKAEGVSLWPLARLCVSMEDLQRFYRLSHIKSELGRGRAWLRGAINERTLENYMHTILSQEEELRRLYEADAFLLDQERSSMLPIMAAGLSSIIFSISTDASYLNTPSRSVEVPSLPAASVPAASVPHVEVPHTQQLPPTTHDTPHSEDALRMAQHSFPSHHLHVQETDDDVIAVSAKGGKKKKRKSKSKSPHLSNERIENDVEHVAPAISSEGDKVVPLKESASSSSSRLSLDSVNDDGQTPLYVALTTPTDFVSGEARAAASATALVLSASSAPLSTDQYLPAALSSNHHPSPPSTTDQHLPTLLSTDQQLQTLSTDQQLLTPLSDNQPLQLHSDQHTPSGDNIHRQQVFSTDDSERSQSPDNNMRTAMLSLSKMKDSLEAKNRELEAKVFLLEQELQTVDDEREAHSNQKLGLERENDLLREQLKKYVSMVQRRNSPSGPPNPDSGTSDVRTPFNAENSPPTNTDTDNAVSTADKKFQEVADMYADLMELNGRLHRSLADKDVTICSLVRLLREAGIEVPLAQHELPTAAMETRVRLVEVWIPSVIRKGRGPDGFHVYQVFVSVKGVEWNVYRRYTEFRDFHRQLQKHLPEVATFNFPPKKAIGNKSTQVVEERRRRLQEYLRFVIKTCSSKASSVNQSQPIINRSISKEVLVTIFPFFKEDFNQDPSVASQPVPSYSGL